MDEHLQRSQEENTKATVMDEVPIQKRMAFIKARLQQLDDVCGGLLDTIAEAHFVCCRSLKI